MRQDTTAGLCPVPALLGPRVSVSAPPRVKANHDNSEVVAPSNVTVLHEHRAVLYLPDGRALIRRAGF